MFTFLSFLPAVYGHGDQFWQTESELSEAGGPFSSSDPLSWMAGRWTGTDWSWIMQMRGTPWSGRARRRNPSLQPTLNCHSSPGLHHLDSFMKKRSKSSAIFFLSHNGLSWATALWRTLLWMSNWLKIKVHRKEGSREKAVCSTLSFTLFFWLILPHNLIPDNLIFEAQLCIV